MKRFNIFENVHFSEDKEIEEIIFENQNIKAIRIVSLNLNWPPKVGPKNQL